MPTTTHHNTNRNALRLAALLLAALSAVLVTASPARAQGADADADVDANGAERAPAPPRAVADVLADGLTLACYNVENMFDAWDDPYTNDESADPKYDFEIKALAATIRESDADVIGIAEVENAQVLQLMIDRYLPDAGYAYVHVMPTNSGRGINLGVISRLPIDSLTSHRFRQLDAADGDVNKHWYFARDLFQVRLRLGDALARLGDDDGLLDFFVVHFKSKRTIVDSDPNSGQWRAAEARGAARIIEAILDDDPEAALAITGDFNDERDTPVLGALAREHDNATGVLHDVHFDLPQAQRISFLKDPYRSQIDFLLVSPALNATLRAGSQRVYNEPERLKASDHALVKATFDLPE